MATPRGLTPLEAANEIRNANNGQVVLVLQGGGALGAYQGGVYQALHDAGIEPDWLIGTSIGAINAAIIAGNAVEDRLPRLQEFWRRVERSSLWGAFPAWTGVSDALSSWTTRAPPSLASLRPTFARFSAPMCRSAPTTPAIIRPSRCAGRWKSSSTSRSSTRAIRGSPWARRMSDPA
jgi:predicted acylesterase/phospholipase RssA